jgi:flagellin
MRINNNIMALNAHRQLGMNQAGAAKSMEKLSSGFRINRAGDDAAGLAISEKMRGQIRGLKQASRNAQDGISLIQTAEGALNETHSILQRMRELAVQASTDTNTPEDRAEIQKEMDQLGEEITRIANTTEFNTKTLLDGNMGKGVTQAVANVNTNEFVTGITDENTILSDLKDKDGNSLGIAEDDVIEVSYVINGQTVTNTLTVAAEGGVVTTSIGDVVALVTDGNADYTGGVLSIEASADGFNGAIHGLTITVKDSDGKVKAGATNALSSFAETTAAEDVRSDGQATFHIGANTNQNVQLSIKNMSAHALGVRDIKVGTQGQANVAIKVIDGATQKVSAERSKLGAIQNRLEHTIANLGTSAENLQAAEARIRDLDMAEEIMAFTKNNILQQAATAMLAQANMAPQSVLQLLG